MNISFAALGHEECFTGAALKNHESSTNHDSKNLKNDWANCKSCNKHIGITKSARQQYQIDAEADNPYVLACSANLQKVNFENGKQSLSYKCKFSEEATILNFLVAKHQKNGLEKPKCKTVCRGISQARKDTLINRLRGIIPVTRIHFWNNLPVSENPV
ncbi:unnamed protein product [Psylliodes chrysocephalus]|uniref:Uncharacterized protein n=1 Tax=Psylliodes chrysocephalus TaxID=3402493 RepID=A0A9P0CIC4_9CUCU|nr:unnamed protein product [Psylliodes chrysocephala]